MNRTEWNDNAAKTGLNDCWLVQLIGAIKNEASAKYLLDVRNSELWVTFASPTSFVHNHNAF